MVNWRHRKVKFFFPETTYHAVSVNRMSCICPVTNLLKPHAVHLTMFGLQSKKSVIPVVAQLYLGGHLQTRMPFKQSHFPVAITFPQSSLGSWVPYHISIFASWCDISTEWDTGFNAEENFNWSITISMEHN